MISKNAKMNIQLGIGALTLIAGIVLIYLGFYADPKGVIDNSVLVAYGETLTFVGALMGIDYAAKRTYSKAIDELRKNTKDKEDE